MILRDITVERGRELESYKFAQRMLTHYNFCKYVFQCDWGICMERESRFLQRYATRRTVITIRQKKRMFTHKICTPQLSGWGSTKIACWLQSLCTDCAPVLQPKSFWMYQCCNFKKLPHRSISYFHSPSNIYK